MASHPSSLSSGTRAAGATPARAALTALVAVVGSVVGATVVALIGKAAGADDAARQLKPGTYIPLVVIGVVFGTIGWFLITRRSGNPRLVLSRLVPAVLLVLFIPDLALGFSNSASWGVVVTLMLMHLAVAAVSLPVFSRLLPLDR